MTQVNYFSHFTINSKDRDDYYLGNPASFRVSLPKPIKVECAKLSSAQIPNTFYNVTANNNKITANSVNYGLSPGCYSLNDLTQALQALLAPLGTVTVSYDNIAGFVTITNSVAFSLTFGANSVAKLIGFNPGLTFTGQTSYTGTLTPKVYSSAVYIGSNLGTAIQTTCRQRPDYTFVIPNTCNKGEIMQFNALTQFDLRPRVKSNFLSVLEFVVYDEDGNQLQGLADWNMTIQVL